MKFIGLIMLFVCSGCEVSGTVGVLSPCGKCDARELCDQASARCVACLADADCKRVDAGSGSCSDGTDCTDGELHCVEGRCQDDEAQGDHGN